jgi:16S rRNA processing protein RimM
VESYTSPPQGLFKYRQWHIAPEGQVRQAVEVADWRTHGSGFIARLAGVETPEAAAAYIGATVWVERAQLAPTKAREYYWTDLIGLVVENLEGIELGRVDHFIDAPANAVMIIKGEREHLVPVTKQHLARVDREQGRVFVDWPADF